MPESHRYRWVAGCEIYRAGVLLRMYDCQSGQVLIDGRDIQVQPSLAEAADGSRSPTLHH